MIHVVCRCCTYTFIQINFLNSVAFFLAVYVLKIIDTEDTEGNNQQRFQYALKFLIKFSVQNI